MTTLSKPVTRRTRGSYAVLYHQARPIVVTLAIGDLLEFREAGRRMKWVLPVDAGFRYAVRLKAQADFVARRTRRKRPAP